MSCILFRYADRFSISFDKMVYEFMFFYDLHYIKLEIEMQEFSRKLLHYIFM